MLMSHYRERERERRKEGRKEENRKEENRLMQQCEEQNSNRTSVNSYNLRTTIKNTFICLLCRHIVFNFVCKMFRMNNEK